jgi:hypothetical protein
MEYAGWSVGEAARALRGGDGPCLWPTDVEAMAHRLRVEIAWARLAAATGGQDALLVPKVRGGFRAVIDPTVGPTGGVEADHWPNSAVLQRAVGRWRLAHELAHTLFYRPGRPPRRRRPWERAEEAFCDAVADELLAPRALVATRSDQDAVVTALELEVPVAAVRRSTRAEAQAVLAERTAMPV